MKVILLVGGPRGGLDLFQSLLDGHEEILQFPGIIYVNDKLKEILSNKSKEKIAKCFIKEYPSFFDSRKSKIERHYMLGEKKRQFYKVDKKKFVRKFISLSKKNLYQNKVFQNLYLLHMAYDQSNKKKKILVINAHIIPFIFSFEKIFKNINFEIIHTIRHPLSAISSTLKNWLKFKKTLLIKDYKSLITKRTVLIETLDNIVDKHNIKIIDLLKIDTEGFEYEVLQGAKKSLKFKKIKAIIIEKQLSDMYLNYNFKKVEKILEKNGFLLKKKFRFPLALFEDRIYTIEQKLSK